MDEEYRKIFVKNLNYYMKAKNITQADIISDLSVSSSTVSNWCTGVKLPRMGKIQMLADYMNINISDLVEAKEKEDKPVVTDNDVKVALFDGDKNVTDEMWDKVKKFAEYVKSKNKSDK